MCVDVRVSHNFYEGVIHLMPGEGECGQDTQLPLCVDMMSLEAHDVEAQSNHVLRNAGLGIRFRPWQSSRSWSICFIAACPEGQRSAQLPCLFETLSPLESIGIRQVLKMGKWFVLNKMNVEGNP